MPKSATIASISTPGRTRRLASIADAAEYTATCTRTIRRRIADGTLTGYRTGPKLLRVDLDEIDSKLLRPIATGGAAHGAA
jgi:excisionase family DNA binding protein